MTKNTDAHPTVPVERTVLPSPARGEGTNASAELSDTGVLEADRGGTHKQNSGWETFGAVPGRVGYRRHIFRFRLSQRGDWRGVDRQFRRPRWSGQNKNKVRTSGQQSTSVVASSGPPRDAAGRMDHAMGTTARVRKNLHLIAGSVVIALLACPAGAEEQVVGTAAPLVREECPPEGSRITRAACAARSRPCLPARSARTQ